MGPDAMIFIFRMLSLLQQQNTGLWIKRGREQQWLSLPVKMKQCFKIHLSPKHLPVVLIFIFLRMNDAEHLFMYPLAIWIFPGYLSQTRSFKFRNPVGAPFPLNQDWTPTTLMGIFPHPSHVPSLPAFPRCPALINFLVGMDSWACLLNAGWKSFAKAVITHTHRTACLFLHYT